MNTYLSIVGFLVILGGLSADSPIDDSLGKEVEPERPAASKEEPPVTIEPEAPVQTPAEPAISVPVPPIGNPPDREAYLQSFIQLQAPAALPAHTPEAVPVGPPKPPPPVMAAPVPPQGNPPDREAYLKDFEELQAVDEEAPEVVDEEAPEVVDERAPEVVAVSPIPEPAPAKPAAPTFVPPGFEELLEPQTTEVDIYYGDRYLTSSLATFTPGTITFHEAGEIIDNIPDLLEEQVVRLELESELPTNSELVCLKANQTGCGTIDPETVEVIFDDSRFRADLFVAPDLLAVRSAVETRYLPPSSAKWSLLNLLSATVDGQEGQEETYNVRNSTTLSYKETRLLSITNVTSEEDFTADTLALEREINGMQYQAGIFRSSTANLVFIGETDFAGLAIASSLDTRTDLDQSSGNELQLFLDRRSRVDIFKDGRLMSTAVYETGNQIIDTSSLPGGAYDIVLRIRDSSGNVTEETRFYVKTLELPPMDQMLFFFDAGELVVREPGHSLPQGTGEGLLRAGVSKRLSPSFGIDAGIITTEGSSLLESGFFKLGRTYDFRLNGAVSNESDYGLNLNSRVRLGRARLHANLRKTWLDSGSLIGEELSQGSVNLAIPMGRTMLNVSARYNKRPDFTDRNAAVKLDFPVKNFRDNKFNSSFQVTRSNGDLFVFLSAQLRRTSGSWQNEVSARGYYEKPEDFANDSGIITNISSSWYDGNRYPSDIRLTMRAVDEQFDETLEADAEIASDYGRANVDAIYSNGFERWSYGANFYTSILANRDAFSFGGKSLARSAIVLDIEGDVEDSWFDVYVNGSFKTNAQIGRKTIVSLRPYEEYEVELTPRGDSLLDYENVRETATLYPGNVVTLNWEVTRIVVAFGQILDERGKPVRNALLEGVAGLATTDEFGLFQAELDSSVRTITARTRGGRCEVALPDFDASRTVVTLGELICR